MPCMNGVSILKMKILQKNPEGHRVSNMFVSIAVLTNAICG